MRRASGRCSTPPDAASLRLRARIGDAERVFALPLGETSAGSTSDNDIVLPVRGVSKRHACFRLDRYGPAVQDLESRNGVFVNGVRREQAPLLPGDEVRLGPVTLVVEQEELQSPLPAASESAASNPDAPVVAAGKTVRDALFLASFDVRLLPSMSIVSSFVAIAAVLGFSQALAARPPAVVIPVAIIVNAVLLCLEWALCLARPAAAALVVYLHLAVFGGTLLSGFWSVVSERLDPYAARRLVGRIGLGASAGGALGGLLAVGLARTLPVATLLIGMAALSLLALVGLRRLRAPTHPHAPPAARAADGPPRALLGLRILGEVEYLRHLAVIVFLGAVSEALLDYGLKAEAVRAFRSDASLAAFFALFQAGIAVATLVAQGSLVRSSLGSLGLAGTVALLPAVAVVGGVSGALAPRLATAVLARGTQTVLQGSLFRAGYELLFTALPRHRKRPTKIVVDVGCGKLGSVAGAALTLALLRLFPGSSTAGLFALGAAFSGLALLLTRRLHDGYVAALEESLLSGALRLDPDEVVDGTTRFTLARTGLWMEAPRVENAEAAAPLDAFSRAALDLASADTARARHALLRPEGLDVRLASRAVPWLARGELAAEAARALRAIAPSIAGLLADTLLDPGRPAELRRRAARLLPATGSDRSIAALMTGLSDLEVRFACGLALRRAVRKGSAVPLPRLTLFEAAAAELERAPREESEKGRALDHVFNLFELVLDADALHAARQALREGGALRGTALEYLSNVLPDRVLRALLPRLGAGRPA